MKSLVCETSVLSVEGITARIPVIAGRIRDMPGNFENVNNFIQCRCQDCQTTSGAGMKNGWRLQGKLADGTVVEFEAGASLFTDPISDVRQMHMNVVKCSN
ncbi:hypothetical protein TNCV_3175771 [Trichonephila clavipes]|nr:hypothetical protein TNCV_3175771 [Trichonephila clavipes]